MKPQYDVVILGGTRLRQVFGVAGNGLVAATYLARGVPSSLKLRRDQASVLLPPLSLKRPPTQKGSARDRSA